MNDSTGRAGIALVAAALYLLVCLFVAGVGYVLYLIAATFGIWLVGGLLFNGARS